MFGALIVCLSALVQPFQQGMGYAPPPVETGIENRKPVMFVATRR